MKLLLVYPPFCTPAIVSYSLVNLHAFLKANNVESSVLDLNVEFHNRKFKEYREYFRSLQDLSDYDLRVKEYDKVSRECYSINNRAVIDNKNPELFDEMISLIVDKKVDVVGFSIVYSSQVFYTIALIKELKRLGIKTIVGGPAVNDNLIEEADYYLKNEFELLEFISGKIEYDKVKCDYSLDYEIFNSDAYFVNEGVVPLKTSHGCYYANCAFCTHHKGEKYLEYNLKNIEETVKKCRHKYFFIIDDMVHKQRILKIADIMKKYNKKWSCQLRPTKDYDLETLKVMHESGCKTITWGVESGCQRILDLMNKTTKVDEVRNVLVNSHNLGIKNVVYIMLGFPTETKEEAEITVKFLEDNTYNIDLVSISIFGLQKGSPVYNEPEKFGVVEVIEEKRKLLPERITYKVSKGMDKEELKKYKKKIRSRIDKINKYPRYMNFFREHILLF
ncbi:MAG: radical SAM protein [Nanoarchaeota archaeon]|nr:radical SAM protein [Nanoarchaeota archaeon]